MLRPYSIPDIRVGDKPVAPAGSFGVRPESSRSSFTRLPIFSAGSSLFLIVFFSFDSMGYASVISGEILHVGKGSLLILNFDLTLPLIAVKVI